MGRKLKTEPVRVEMLLAYITRTDTGHPASWGTVTACFGSDRIHPAPEEGWYWMAATPRSAARMRRDGHRAVGSVITTWYPKQMGALVDPTDVEPEGEHRPMYGEHDEIIGMMAERASAPAGWSA